MYVEKLLPKQIIDKTRKCNEDGLVISDAMEKAISITNYRRALQNDFNKKH